MKFGIGEWRMRNGEKAVVTEIDNGELYLFRGHIDGLSDAWNEHGKFNEHHDESNFDLIAPWQEETPKPEAPVETYADKVALAVLLQMVAGHGKALGYIPRDVEKAYEYSDAFLAEKARRESK